MKSLRKGDGSPVPPVRTPTVTKKTLTSIHLEWDPVETNNGTPVYLIKMIYTGDGPTDWYIFDHVCMIRESFEYASSCSPTKFFSSRCSTHKQG